MLKEPFNRKIRLIGRSMAALASSQLGFGFGATDLFSLHTKIKNKLSQLRDLYRLSCSMSKAN